MPIAHLTNAGSSSTTRRSVRHRPGSFRAFRRLAYITDTRSPSWLFDLAFTTPSRRVHRNSLAARCRTSGSAKMKPSTASRMTAPTDLPSRAAIRFRRASCSGERRTWVRSLNTHIPYHASGLVRCARDPDELPVVELRRRHVDHEVVLRGERRIRGVVVGHADDARSGHAGLPRSAQTFEPTRASVGVSSRTSMRPMRASAACRRRTSAYQAW